MNVRRTITALLLSLAILPTLGSQALADPEWCDTGSPPPNDFRFRPTGGPSAGSSTAWLGSTTSGDLYLAQGINTLAGGVAKGMRTALLHAPAWEDRGRHDRSEWDARKDDQGQHDKGKGDHHD